MSNSLVEIKRINNVGLLTLNNPDKLNALSPTMLHSIANAAEELENDVTIRVLVITGNDRAFAAGADIETLSRAGSKEISEMNTIQYWNRIRAIGKPIIAAVSGFVYGGGCELALTCDIIIASENAKFAQPEIKLGIMPGGGGTQRLAKAIGPYKAMEMVLTGNPISARQAYEWNLVNRVVPIERYLQEAIDLAEIIGNMPPLAVKSAKQAIRTGSETTIAEGLVIERKLFSNLFDTADQSEGMQAFLEKRKPDFKGN